MNGTSPAMEAAEILDTAQDSGEYFALRRARMFRLRELIAKLGVRDVKLREVEYTPNARSRDAVRRALEDDGSWVAWDDYAQLRAALEVVLDQVDYTRGACSATEMVGAVLPKVVIENARKVLGV